MPIAFERRGSGEPLVLLHGIGMSGRVWDPVVALIEDERELITVDMPGFGDSSEEPLPDPPSIENYAEVLRSWFAELGLERPHVAGNSMGGGVALELARAGAVASATLFSPNGFSAGRISKPWVRTLLRGAWEGGRLGTRGGAPSNLEVAISRPATFVLTYGRPFKVPAEVLRSATLELAGSKLMPTMPYVAGYSFAEKGDLDEVPLTVAWGRRDLLLSWWPSSRRARRMLPKARHVDLRGCGHVPFSDDPERCAEILIEGSQR